MVTAIPRRTLIRLSAVVWLTFGLAQCLQSYVLAHAAGRPWTLSGALIGGMPWWLSWFLLTPVIAWLATRHHFTAGRVWRPLGAHIVACVVISSVHLAVVGSVYWFTVGRDAGVATSLANQVQRFFGNFFLESVVTYAGAAGVIVAIDFARAVRDKEVSRARLEKQAVELEASLARARLDALRMELNPHFLFNTLTAIAGLVGQDRKAEAREVIGRLAHLLRRALDGGQEPFGTVETELELVEDYLFIQRLRLGDRLSIERSVGGDARDCLIPSMLLLQLVENAIRHGIEPLERRGTVTIQIDRVAASVRISIHDTGAGFVFRGDRGLRREGIGISNTRARLAHVYGDRAALVLQNREQGGAEAIVVVPAVTNGASPHTVPTAALAT
jgi:hypothetical protein